MIYLKPSCFHAATKCDILFLILDVNISVILYSKLISILFIFEENSIQTIMRMTVMPYIKTLYFNLKIPDCIIYLIATDVNTNMAMLIC